MISAGAAKKAGQEQDRQRKNRSPALDCAEQGGDDQDGGTAEKAFGRAPQQFSQDNIVDPSRGGEDCFVGLLWHHSGVDGPHAFERRGVSRREGDESRCKKCQVGNFRHLADKHSESISEAEQIDEGLPELRQRTPHRHFSPDQDVPMPHGQGFAARAATSRSSA